MWDDIAAASVTEGDDIRDLREQLTEIVAQPAERRKTCSLYATTTELGVMARQALCLRYRRTRGDLDATPAPPGDRGDQEDRTR